jgi:hypothetical protein
VTRRSWAYLALCQALMFIMLGLGGYGYTNYVDQRRADDERRAAAERQRQAEETRLIVCQVALGQADAFREATSPTGQQARAGWLKLAQQLHCE